MSRVLKSAGLALAVGFALLGGASVASADAEAWGIAAGSPGVLSGNLIQVPVDIPINFCGNSINVIGFGNLAADNVCINA
ncbi:chaplin [Streptomyces sp. IBSNAI002]|uniref:chaplin n=1 Tax=Streptomyces sp. IBSNAI002 TaxID=3457500 RepID=UPI003FCFAAF9